MAALKLGLATLLVFGASIVAMAWSQEDVIFPTRAVAPPGPLPAGAERLSVAVPSGDRLEGVYIPPARTSGTQMLLLGFGGNAWNGEDVASYLHELYPQAHVVAFHYRGYRPSTGSPSAEALIADAPLVLESAVARVKPDRTVAVGFSIGSGVAASLANRPELDGLVLVTPFDSMKAVVRQTYPWLPIGLFRNEIDSVKFVQGSEVPVAIISAERDQIIPPGRTDALREQVPNLVYDGVIESAGHNDVYTRSEFQQAMREALEAIISA